MLDIHIVRHTGKVQPTCAMSWLFAIISQTADTVKTLQWVTSCRCHTLLTTGAFASCVEALFSFTSLLLRPCLLSRAFWEEVGGAVQGARRPQAGSTLHAAQRGSVPGAAQAGGAQRPPAGAVWSLQVSSRKRRWRIKIKNKQQS